jgi:serine/threonine-protein kinase
VAHDSGVVHRDIKPSNIFLARDRDGEVDPKLLDFGISKLSTALASKSFGATPFNQLMGSPLYLPPEAVNGSGNMTPKSDQYSLGVVLYECVIGKPPFGGDTLLEVLNAISTGAFPRPRQQRAELSSELERAILRATDRDPARRFEHMRDFGRALIEVATPRTQVRWGRTFGRRDLSDPPRSLPASALSIAPAERRARWQDHFKMWRRTSRVGVAAGAILVTLLGLISWIGSSASEREAAHAPAADGTRGDRLGTPASAQARVASPAMPVGTAVVAQSQRSAEAPAERPAPTTAEPAASAALEPRSGKETGAGRRREVAAVRGSPPAPAASEPREVEVSAPPRPVDLDDLNPFSIQRVASPGRRRAVIVRGANESPILD